MKKRKYSLGFLTLKEETNLFKKLEKEGVQYEYDHIDSEKPLIVDINSFKEEDAITLEETLLEEFGAQLMEEFEDSIEDSESTEENIQDNLQEIPRYLEERISFSISEWIESLQEGGYSLEEAGSIIIQQVTAEVKDNVGFQEPVDENIDSLINEVVSKEEEEDLEEIE